VFWVKNILFSQKTARVNGNDLIQMMDLDSESKSSQHQLGFPICIGTELRLVS
jgi:hypothetical protein